MEETKRKKRKSGPCCRRAKNRYLGNNLLSESIPPDLGNISSLILLDLHDNDLSGQLPQQLGNLTNLQDVDLSNNKLTGSLPSSFHQLQKLHNFNIRGNSFHGTISEFISTWTDLGKLILSGNNFSGPPLPTAIMALTNLTYLGTNFSIPEVNNSEHVSWETLILRNCSLTGPMPTFIWNLSRLSHLDLSFNNFFGGIPTDVHPHFHPNSIDFYSFGWCGMREIHFVRGMCVSSFILYLWYTFH